MGRQHMLQFRLNDKQWEEITEIRKKHCFDNNGQLYKLLFFNAMLGMQREKELEELQKLNRKIDSALGKEVLH
ncbi:MAG: hypothetical protein N4R16_04970 [Lactobacillus crispatus]|nr:hypothetical protein [Lactobacillus crispatus]